MSLADLTFRIATQPAFADEIFVSRPVALESAGDDADIFKQVLKGERAPSSTGGPKRREIVLANWPDGTWPTDLNPQIYIAVREIWRETSMPENYAALMQAALPGYIGAQRLSWTELPGLCCQAAGGKYPLAEDVATAWALLSAACHLLDDIADGDRPDAWWLSMGPGAATNVATGLLTTAWRALNGLRRRGVPESTAADIVDDFQRTFLQVCAGQQGDLLKAEPSLEECWRIVEAKSGLFFALTCRTGARLATADEDVLSHCSAFGFHLGLLIQIANDVSGIWHASGVQSDLAAGCRWTLPVAYAMAVAPAPLQDQLRDRLRMATYSQDAQDEIRSMLAQAGALLYLGVEALRHRRELDRALEAMQAPGAVSARLAAIADATCPRYEEGNADAQVHPQTLVE